MCKKDRSNNSTRKLLLASSLPWLDFNKLKNKSWAEIAVELKLLDDFSTLNSHDIANRLKVYKEFLSILKLEMEDYILDELGMSPGSYDFEEQVEETWQDLAQTIETWPKSSSDFKFLNNRNSYLYLKNKIQEIE